ncbi:sensor histidine kinase, partial [Virgisporangium aliadipatigenens]|uniref:sensor histidine kinase n=1 Tax=Virgisporangium aliadipatigenens TaxID=741659 RepID=UPI0019417F58
MPVRTALDALAQRPSWFVRSAWPWRSLAYLSSGAVVGLVMSATLVMMILAGLVLAVTVVGMAVLLAIGLSGIWIARFERWRLRLVDLTPMPDPHRAPATSGRRAWLKHRLREPATWREFGFVMVSAMALWWIDGVVVGLALYVPFIFLTAPFYAGQEEMWIAVPGFFFGVALVPVAAYPVTAWAGARAAMSRAILAPRDDELDERLTLVTRSRARLVDAFEVERRRIERDLHDGAQQRLVALTMKLGLARLDLPAESPAAAQVAEAHDLAKLALAELRELIRGVHPKILTDRGLPAAFADVAGRSPVPVTLDVDLPERLPPAVEVTAYFAVVEALANVAKHSGAGSATVYARRDGRLLRVEVRDDGSGGADPARGSGLTGLADRVAAVDGALTLASPPGGPTLLRIEIP